VQNIIDYTIDSAKKSKIFSDIFVSSDDRKIIKIARKYKKS
jgi:CMP-N-acetylneuraminic acid synthetase